MVRAEETIKCSIEHSSWVAHKKKEIFIQKLNTLSLMLSIVRRFRFLFLDRIRVVFIGEKSEWR
jgi:hypothetical protein